MARSPRKQQSPVRRKSHPQRLRPGVRALREIRMYQRTTDLLIPRASFGRLIRAIVQTRYPFAAQFMWQRAAVDCLQEASETYITSILADSYLCSLHAKRLTLMPQDIQLVRGLRGPGRQ